MTENNQTQLAKIPANSRGLVLSSLDDMVRFADGVVKSRLAPKSFDTSAKVVIAIQTGLELGMQPMQALQGLHVINGKVGLSGDTAVALIQASGKAIIFKRFYKNAPVVQNPTAEDYADDFCAVVQTKRHDGQMGYDETVFSIADAKTAKLWGKAGPWTQYWKRMLMYRAIGFHSRDYFGDVTKGMVVSEELQDYPTLPAPDCDTPKRADRKKVESKTTDGGEGSTPAAATDGSGADSGMIEAMLRGFLNKFQEKVLEKDPDFPLETMAQLVHEYCGSCLGGEIAETLDLKSPQTFNTEMLGELNKEIGPFIATLTPTVVEPEPKEESPLVTFYCSDPQCERTFRYGKKEGVGVQCECHNGTLVAEKPEPEGDPEDVKSFDQLEEEAEAEKEAEAGKIAEAEAEAKKKFGKQWEFKCLNKKCNGHVFDKAAGTEAKPICPLCLGSKIQKAGDDSNE